MRRKHTMALFFILLLAPMLMANDLVLVGLSNGAGSNGSFWRSDLFFVPHGCEEAPWSMPGDPCYVKITTKVSNSTGIILTREDWFESDLPVTVENVLSLLGINEAHATLILHTEDPSWVEGFARTFTTLPNKSPAPTHATYGQIIPPFDPLEPKVPYFIANAADRLNIFAFNPSKMHYVSVCIGDSRWYIPPQATYFLITSWEDVTLVTNCNDLPGVDSLPVYITPSSVDNETNDPTTVMPISLEKGGRHVAAQ